MARGLYIIGVAALLLSAVGCSKASEESGQNVVEQGYGTVSLMAQVSGEVLTVEMRSGDKVELADSLIPSSADFSVSLKGSYIDPAEEDDSLIYEVDLSYDSVDSYNEELPLLYTNDEGYAVAVSYGDSTQEGENLPCFAGEATIYVVARAQTDSSIDVTLQNSIFTFSTAEWFDVYFTDAEFVVTTSAGAKFNFSKGVDERLIFVEAGTVLTLSGSATKTTGASVEFETSEIVVTNAATLHSIIIDASQAAEGGITVEIDGVIIETDDKNMELNEDSLSYKDN